MTHPFYHYQVTDKASKTPLIKLTTTHQLNPQDGILADLAAAYISALNLDSQIANAKSGKYTR